MNIRHRSTLVVAILAGTGIIGLWSACGGDSPAPITDMGGSGGASGAGDAAGSETDSGSGTSGGGGADTDASATAGAAGTGGGGSGSDTPADVATPPACVEKAACINGPDPGLCTGGMCASCTDVTGDPACVAAYGAGHLCIEGVCVHAQCRVPSDCGDAGKTCVNSACVSTGCHSDGDCTDLAKPVCDVPSANCVSGAAACATKAAGDVCAAAASKHLCCGTTLECRALDCCTSAQCPVGQTCSAQGTCASASCAAVSGIGPYYVDAGDPGTNGRTGSSTCPFKSITQALAFVTNPTNPQNVAFNVTIAVRSAISEANEGVGAFPIYVGSRIMIEGAGGAPTDPHPVVTVPDGSTGFIFNYVKPQGSQAFGGISQLTITQATAVTDDTKQGYGIQVTATHPNVGEALAPALSITVDHVTIQKFLHGIHVDAGGYADLGPEISATENYHGVFVDNGYVNVGHTGASDAPSHFDQNFHSGIYVNGASILHMNGDDRAVDGGTVGKTMTVDRNHYGVRLKSFGPIPTGLSLLLQGVEMNTNSKPDSMASTSGAGLYVYAGGNPIQVRSSAFSNNYWGVYVGSDTASTKPNDLSGIDLGGQNTFSGGNTNTLLCVGIAAIDPMMKQLNAINNKWNGKDCSTATLAADGGLSVWLKTASDCSTKLDVGGMSFVHTQGYVNVKNCAVTQ